MKKMMGLVLGLSLAIGAFSFGAFAQGGKDTTTKSTKKGGGKNTKKAGKDTTKS